MKVYSYLDARGETTRRCQVAVVGSGPGGAAVARELARRGADVLVLEEGPARPRFRPNLAHTQRYHMQEQGMMVARGDGLMPIAAGRGVGGGSLINSAICFRTPSAVLDGWSERLGGDVRFDPAALAPVYAELEERLQIATTPDEVAGENNRLIVRGARALGFPGGLVARNAPDCAGCGLCNYGCPVGGKASVDRNLLPDAVAAGARVQADVRVDELVVEGERMRGLAGEVRHPDRGEVLGRLRVQAERVVLCCGGIGTPRLLHHSGLAERLGPAVGRGLHVHPGSAVLGLCDHEVKMWTGATQGAWFEDPALPGVLPHTMSAPPGAMLVQLGGAGAPAKAAHALLPHLCGCVVMVSDVGQGRVGATRSGRADIRYHIDPGDLRRIKAGMRSTARVLRAGGAHTLLAPVHGVGRHSSVESLMRAVEPRGIEDFTTYASHPMASCRMSADPAEGVIGPDGAAHGLRGLYLADSSVFPTSLGVNPQLTTMAVATVIGRSIPLA